MKSTNAKSVFALITENKKKFYLIGFAALMCVLLPFGYSLAANRINSSSWFEEITIEPVQQEQLTGQWTAEMKKGFDDKIWFSITHRSESGSFSQSSNTTKLDTFRGLTLDQINAPNSTNVRFDIVRDAGTISCEGVFKNGNGEGFFAFTANQSYVSEMRKRGYENLEAKQIFQLAVHDVSLKYIDEIAAAGYPDLPFNKLFAFRIHGVSAQFINDFRAKGYDKIKPNDLVAMRIHGVTTELVDSLNNYGLKNLPINKLVDFRIHGVTPEFIEEMRKMGYTDISAEKLVAFRIHGVTPEFINELKQVGFDRVDDNDLVAFRIHGVKAEFIKQVRNFGYNPTANQLVSMRIHGVTGEYIEKMRGKGLKDLTIQDLISMCIHGIN